MKYETDIDAVSSDKGDRPLLCSFSGLNKVLFVRTEICQTSILVIGPLVDDYATISEKYFRAQVMPAEEGAV